MSAKQRSFLEKRAMGENCEHWAELLAMGTMASLVNPTSDMWREWLGLWGLKVQIRFVVQGCANPGKQGPARRRREEDKTWQMASAINQFLKGLIPSLAQ